MSSELLQKHCKPCEGGTKPLPTAVVASLHSEVPEWQLSADSKMLSRDYTFTTFPKAMHFANVVADLAEIEDHHPTITVAFNKVRLELFTHAIKGLSENDFILAAKIDAVPRF